MKTVQQEAKDLIHRFEELLPCEGTTDGYTLIKCALITVDEILKAGKEDYIVSQYFNDAHWVEVKQELEKQL